MGELHGVCRVSVVAGIRGAFIQGHDDIRADFALNVNGALRGEDMAGAVDMGLEGDAFLLDFSLAAQGIDLVAAAVRENGAFPAHEFMQSARLAEDLGAGAEVEVVSVAQDDLGFDVLCQFMLVDGAHGAMGSHGHEDGCFDLAVGGFQKARPGSRSRVGML